jgi:3',5'-cyclic AMP phosphodiesterase CpdA
LRIIHLSDIHVWRLAFNPLRLLGKRSVGFFSLLRGRARRFRLERLSDVVERVQRLDADHILITGDLTTMALPGEFADARAALAPLLVDGSRVTVLPGNHDRYTTGSVRRLSFEGTFGAFAPAATYPWLRHLDPETAILGLDPTRSHISARGLLPIDQLDRAERLVADPATRPRRLIVACHYPAVAPAPYRRELSQKRMVNAEAAISWLATLGPHLYCCGHVHVAWAFEPAGIPGELCLNSGAPLLRDHTGTLPPGFLQIDLNGDDVSVTHHAWSGNGWIERPMIARAGFFARPS